MIYLSFHILPVNVVYLIRNRLLSLVQFGLIFVLDGSLFGEIEFNRQVLPILSENCFKCHGPDERAREADMRLDTPEGAFADLGGGYYPIVPGNPQKSEIIWRIYADDEDDLMPHPDSGLSLKQSEKDTIRRWIEEGAKWEEHWSFEPVVRPALPKINYIKWPRNEIDHFVMAKLEENGLSPSPEAEKTTLIRRVTLDLTGLPPTLTEVDTFLADDAPGAYERVVDRLLASSNYGEAMALPWLDAARYADTDGYQNDGPRDMWRWRDWVIEAYNQNMPFDQFTIEQLAGDLLPNPTLEQIIATGFNRNHRYNSESGIVFEEYLLENAVDRVDTTSTVWMGLTMGCARCHDHKYDPFLTKEYYQLISFFNSIRESGRAVKYGNSEPWITAPTKDEFEVVFGKDEVIAKSLIALEQAEVEIASDQKSWESAGVSHASEENFMKDGLVYYYSFDGKDKGLSVTKGQPYLSSGVSGTAARLDGESHFQVESEPIFVSEYRYSLSFWLNPDDVSQGVIVSRQNPNMGRPGVAVELRDGKLQFYIISGWISGVGAVETIESLIPGEWRHVVLTNDGSKRALGQKIYLDGKEVPTDQIQSSNSNHNAFSKNGVFKVGGGVHGPDFKGMVDELRIYNRTLWDDEIEMLAVPEQIREIAATKVKRRTETASKKLRSYFLSNAASKRHQALASTYYEARLDRLKYQDSLPSTMVMQEMEEPRETHIRVRGVYHELGAIVERKLPDLLSDSNSPYAPNRLGLAEWLVSGKHPLTSRVAANRYWLKYFGHGLVKTAEDFGIQGSRPTHPDLLDWLADEFVRLNWDVKAMQKLIVSSATYRQSSRVTANLLEKDPDNQLYARGTRQRLSAHASRDQALAVSGLLVNNIGGPSVSPYQPDNFWEYLSNMTYEQSEGDDLYRRSLYTFWKRTIPPPSMTMMDAADRESCIVLPKRTNTPLQALTMLNEKAFVEAARNLGQRILLEGGETVTDQVEFAFRMVAARYPNSREQFLLENAYKDYQWLYSGDIESSEKLVAVGESKALENLDPKKLAAATTFANMLLNIDEVVTKE